MIQLRTKNFERIFGCAVLLCFGNFVSGQSGPNDVWWDGDFGNPGLNGPGHALAVQGRSVYVAGAFTSAGNVPAQGLARWDGTNWSAVGGGINYPLFPPLVLAVLGETVFVGGVLTNVFDTNGANVPVTNIAEWNGSRWLGLNGGVDGTVSALAAHDGWLYAGGSFTNAGGVTARGIARWNGTNWSSVGGSVNGSVYSLATHGPYLYAGGTFSQAGGIAAARIARWNGTNWETFAGGISGAGVRAVAVNDSEVFVSRFASDSPGVMRWNGSVWDAPLNPFISPIALAANNFLYFSVAGVGTWTACGNLQTLGSGISKSLGGAPTVNAFALAGTNLYATGDFDRAGGKSSFRIARWRAAGFSRFTVTGATHPVGSSGTNFLPFTVSACPAPWETTILQYRTINGTAVPGFHYEPVTGALVFARSGPSQQTVSVPIFGRPSHFFPKSLSLILETTNGILASSLQASGSIISSLPAPKISIADAVVVEGDAGTNQLEFTLSLTAPLDEPLNVPLRYQDVTAFTNVDYLPFPTNVLVPAGSVTQAFQVPVLPNGIREVDKEFRLTLGLLMTNKGVGLGTILNDDSVAELRPALSHSIFETAIHTTSAIPVRLSAPPGTNGHGRFHHVERVGSRRGGLRGAFRQTHLPARRHDAARQRDCFRRHRGGNKRDLLPQFVQSRQRDTGCASNRRDDLEAGIPLRPARLRGFACRRWIGETNAHGVRPGRQAVGV